ncbi:MAG TPA: hypothetical protein DIC60_04760 [Lachnospiraceae bacterium]|nr:hypothetical protein [Lachnospiraceae bacterium]
MLVFLSNFDKHLTGCSNGGKGITTVTTYERNKFRVSTLTPQPPLPSLVDGEKENIFKYKF